MLTDSYRPVQTLTDLTNRAERLASSTTRDATALSAASEWLLDQALSMYAFQASDHIEKAVAAFAADDLATGRQHLAAAASSYVPAGA